MREWLAATLSTDPDLVAVLDDRMYQGESLDSSQVTPPFLVYTIGNATDERLSEEPDSPVRQFFQIYIHDRGGDYTQIDNIVGLVKARLKNQSDKDAGIITVVYLETSRDLDDQTMGTILRYIRFVAIKEK